MNLALFDLDHTLIPFDSGMAWTRFLIERGVLGPEFESIYLEECKLYVTGTLDIHALHRTMVTPLGRLPRTTLDALLRDFRGELAPTLPAASHALVARHRAAGDLCCVVTATTRFIAERYAHGFGIEHLLATEAALDAGGSLTGDIDGLPCYREHKLARLHEWLAARGRRLGEFERSSFYSDSFNDLPLLQAVSDPVAVRPDPRLRAMAEAKGWPIEMLASPGPTRETAG
jgi:HAD superfamily hydrolase (TIGR01490 family)